jgi:hypothetical protein
MIDKRIRGMLGVSPVKYEIGIDVCYDDPFRMDPELAGHLVPQLRLVLSGPHDRFIKDCHMLMHVLAESTVFFDLVSPGPVFPNIVNGWPFQGR